MQVSMNFYDIKIDIERECNFLYLKYFVIRRTIKSRYMCMYPC